MGHPWRGFSFVALGSCIVLSLIICALWLRAIDNYADKHPPKQLAVTSSPQVTAFAPVGTPKFKPESKRINQESRGAHSPNIVQKGKNNIAVFGDNNQATIIEKEHLVLGTADGIEITDKLKGFAGHGIKIFLNRETTETSLFGNALADRLRKAGVNVPEITHMQVFEAMPPGISFIVSKKNPDINFVNSLTSILTDKKLAKNPIPASWSDRIDVSILYITPLD